MRSLQNGLTAQELLWRTHREGISVRLNGRGGLRLTPTRLLTPGLIKSAKALKPQLLSLVSSLERYGVQDDPLILEALALFNAEPKGFTASPRMPQERSRMPQECAAKPEATQIWLKLGAV